MPACVSSVPTSLEITGIGLVGLRGDVAQTGGVYFGGHPTEALAPKPLAAEFRSMGDFSTSMLEQTECGPDGPRLWVGVTVVSEGHWEASGIFLEYRADGRDYRTEWQLGLRVCAAGDDPAPECRGGPTTPVIDVVSRSPTPR
jgi:hypothetical protein